MAEAAGNQRIGTAYLDVEAKMDKSAKNSIENELSAVGTTSGNLFSSKFGASLKKLGGTLAALGIGKMIADTISDSIKAYADYEQLVGGVETLFKDSADMVQAYAAKAYKNQGISANQYMETVTSFSASLLQSLGGDTEKAAKYADMAITDMSDNANKMGTSMESIQLAYQGFARGQYGLLDNLKLGYGGTRSEMARLLADAEKISGIKYDISNLSDVYDAIHVVQTELGITGTTAKEAATTLSGAFGMLKSSWQNVLVALADPSADFSVVFGEMVDSASTLLKNAIPVIGEIATQLIIQLPDAVIQLAPVLLEAVGQMLMDVMTRLNEWMGEVMLEFANWFIEVLDGIGQWFTDIGNAVSDGIDAVVDWFATLPSRVLSLLYDLAARAYDAGASIVKSFGEGILANFSAALDPMAALAEAASGYLPHSPAKYGAFSGKGYPLYAGEAIAESLGEGFTRRIGMVQAQVAAGMAGIAATIDGSTNNYNVSMNVTADSTTTLEGLIDQAKRARVMYGRA